MSRYCRQCGKAKVVCICTWIKPVQCQTELIILQHPSEVKQAKGSAKILTMSLANARLFIGEDFSHHPQLNALLADAQVQHQVLYPSEHSLRLEKHLQPDLSSIQKRRLILLDGTWKKAYKMWQLSTNLHALPCVHLPSDYQTNYRIRKAPSQQHLSTVEAGCFALQQLEPDLDISPMLNAFERMIDFQIQHISPEVYQRNYRDQ